MAKRRRYSDAERAEVLAALVANGNNVQRTAGSTGVPAATITYWAKGQCHPSVANLSEQKKAPLADLFETFVSRVLSLTTDADIQGATLRDRFTAAGIAIDKARLLRGEPTAINEEREDGKLAEFRKRYAALHATDASADPGTDHDSQPVLAAPDAHGAATAVPGAGAA